MKALGRASKLTTETGAFAAGGARTWMVAWERFQRYKCPRHHRTKNCEALFFFPRPQFEAARRATWHT